MLNRKQDLYLLDALLQLGFINGPETESQSKLLNYLQVSQSNIQIRRQRENWQVEIGHNLYTVSCAILDFKVHDEGRPCINDQTLLEYINAINFNQDEQDLIFIDQFAAIKNMINRPHFSIKHDQVKLIHSNFRNLCKTRELISYELVRPVKYSNFQDSMLTMKTKYSQSQFDFDHKGTPKIIKTRNHSLTKKQTKVSEREFFYKSGIPKKQSRSNNRVHRVNRSPQKRRSMDVVLQDQKLYQLTREQLEDLTNAYKSMDIDGDGSITRRELTFLLRGMKQQVSEEMITQFIDRADTNRDGVISFDEFVNLVLKDSGIQMPDSGKLKQNINKIEVSGNRTTAKGPRYKHEPVKPEPQRHRSDKDFIFTRIITIK